MRFWTSDWHINSEIVRQVSHRPWKTADEMNHGILKMTYDKNVKLTDQIIHVGDLIQSGKDRGIAIPKEQQLDWNKISMKCACQIIPIEGNHDSHNAVPFICRSMKTRVGKYNVTVGHYPTWYNEAAGTFNCMKCDYPPDIHICGHVHNSWKVSYDKKHRILNINVGIDAHNYKLLSDADLVELIEQALRYWKFVDTSAEHWWGDKYTFDVWQKDIVKQKQLNAIEKKTKELEWLKANKPEIYAKRMKHYG